MTTRLPCDSAHFHHLPRCFRCYQKESPWACLPSRTCISPASRLASEALCLPRGGQERIYTLPLSPTPRSMLSLAPPRAMKNVCVDCTVAAVALQLVVEPAVGEWI